MGILHIDLMIYLSECRFTRHLPDNDYVAVSCGYDTQFAVRLVMDYTIS